MFLAPTITDVFNNNRIFILATPRSSAHWDGGRVCWTDPLELEWTR